MSDSGTAANKNSNQTNNLNNSQNNSATNSSFKYKLVEFRYGKEEMLALFDAKVKMQPKMKEFTGLISDKCQTPLSLIPMTDEEQRLWSKSLNSDVVMRLANKAGSLNNNQNGQPNQLNNGLPNERGGINNLERGNSLDNRGLNLRASGLRNNNINDRGRGRQRTGFMRNSSYEDENNENYSPTANNDLNRREYRPKSFDRLIDDSNSNQQRETKPPFERQFSKPPQISNSSNETNDQDTNRLNFRSKPQSSSLDSQQQPQQSNAESSWRSNRERTNPRIDNPRRNLDWRNKFRSDETNNQSASSAEWKRPNNLNNNSNDRWRNDNETEEGNDNLDRRRFFNNKLNNKDKLAWGDNEDDKRSNLPEWSLDDDAILDRSKLSK